jgi:hypothetical protein
MDPTRRVVRCLGAPGDTTLESSLPLYVECFRPGRSVNLRSHASAEREPESGTSKVRSESASAQYSSAPSHERPSGATDRKLSAGLASPTTAGSPSSPPPTRATTGRPRGLAQGQPELRALGQGGRPRAQGGEGDRFARRPERVPSHAPQRVDRAGGALDRPRRLGTPAAWPLISRICVAGAASAGSTSRPRPTSPRSPGCSRPMPRMGSGTFCPVTSCPRTTSGRAPSATACPTTSGAGRVSSRQGAQVYFKCCARYLFISNIVTLSFPKIGLSLLSARISRRFSGFCRFCFLM